MHKIPVGTLPDERVIDMLTFQRVPFLDRVTSRQTEHRLALVDTVCNDLAIDAIRGVQTSCSLFGAVCQPLTHQALANLSHPSDPQVSFASCCATENNKENPKERGSKERKEEEERQNDTGKKATQAWKKMAKVTKRIVRVAPIES